MTMQIHSGRFSLGLLVLSALFGCEEATDWEFRPHENGALVVEAIITDEFTTQEVLLSLSREALNGEALPAAGAEVRLWGGGDTLAFQPDAANPGRYLSLRPFSAQLRTLYTLEVLWDGTSYLAESEMVAILPFSRISFVAAGAGDSLSIGEVAPLYSPDEQAMYEVDVDWQHLVNSEPARARLFFYTFNTVDINELFRPPQEKVAFPRGSRVIEKKYSLNPEFAAYLRALLMETEWQGGILDEDSGSLPTNISGGGLGFFSVCAVLSDTLVAE